MLATVLLVLAVVSALLATVWAAIHREISIAALSLAFSLFLFASLVGAGFGGAG